MEIDLFSPMPTQDENVSPWPLCENLLAKPCSPPLCARRSLRTPISGPAWPEASPFPLIAPSIESSNPICLLFRLIWFLLAPGCGSVSLFDCFLFGHVFALLRFAVKTRAFLVVNVRLGVDPDHTIAAARCGCCVRRRLGRGARCGRWVCGGWTG